MPLFARFRHDLATLDARVPLSGQAVLAAVSGGPDSLCLLHLLRRAAPEFGYVLHVATLDHSLRGEAGVQDAAFVAALAAEWGLAIQRGRSDVPALCAQYNLGVEAAARLARYTFLAEAARQIGGALIATGHNADDQAETVLLHLIRGTGLAGLSGMRPLTALSADHVLPEAPAPRDLWIARPLLAFTRAEIEAYCAAHDLQPRQDATNAETATLRNRLRLDILPRLETLNPAIRATLARTARVAAEDTDFLAAQTATAWQAIVRETDADRLELDRARFRDADLAPALRRAVLRRAALHLAPPGTEVGLETLEAALRIAQDGPTGHQATLPGGVILTVMPDALVLARPDAPAALPPGPWLAPGTDLPVPVPGGVQPPGTPWVLHTRWLAPGEDAAALRRQPHTSTLAVPPDAALIVRTRRPGDRFQPPGLDGHSQKLSDAWINARIPAAWRDHLPLLVVGEAIAWVGMGDEGRVGAPFMVAQFTENILVIRWESPKQTIRSAAYGN